MMCPKCGNTELDELGVETSGAEHYGCPKCRISFTISGEPYGEEPQHSFIKRRSK